MRVSLVILLGLLAAAPANAQPDRIFPPVDTASVSYGTGSGVAILLNEYGFGLGGLFRAELRPGTSALVEVGLGAGKDAREQQFFVGIFGDTVTPFKRNYVLLAPLHMGVEQRLFREQIEDNFRPFVQLAAGPAAAYQWPYFRDVDEDGLRDEGEELYGPFGGFAEGSFRLGVGGIVSAGAYFGRSRRSAQGIRFGYQAQYFFAPVQLLEPDPEVENPERQFFGTPVVTFYFMRLVN
jgi:hypothetical protein